MRTTHWLALVVSLEKPVPTLMLEVSAWPKLVGSSRDICTSYLRVQPGKFWSVKSPLFAGWRIGSKTPKLNQVLVYREGASAAVPVGSKVSWLKSGRIVAVWVG